MEFLTWRCWIGFWVMIILFGVVALEGCFLIKYFTRFSEDIFELLISAIFIYEPIALLVKVRALSCTWLHNASYFCLIEIFQCKRHSGDLMVNKDIIIIIKRYHHHHH